MRCCQPPTDRQSKGTKQASLAQVVLGTESGMITAIVKRVQQRLAASGRSDVDVEIVFPVASEAITTPERASQVQV